MRTNFIPLNFKDAFFKISLVGIAILTIHSCSNDFQSNDVIQEITNDELIPINLSGQIFEIQTRTQDNAFVSGDQIGVFVLEEPNTLARTRHADNICFSYQPDGAFTPEHEIFFPIGNSTSTFISYYPYQTQAVNEGSNLIDVSVKADQSKDANFYLSDFLTATLTKVIPTKHTLMLNYSHSMSMLNIHIKTSNDFDNQSISTGATICITGLNTQGKYNLEEQTFSALSSEQTLIPHGHWDNQSSRSTNLFTGKQVILPPQPITEGKITIITNNKEYTAKLPSSLKLEQGKQSTITLNFDSSIGINNIKASITEWGESLHNGESNLIWTEKSNSLLVTEKLFTESLVVDLVNKDNQKLGFICKEYLQNDIINAQAYVLYANSNKMSGSVLQIIGNEQAIHGGSITWENNNLIYTPGSSLPIQKIYLSQDEQLSTLPVESDQELRFIPQTLIDQRGKEIISYPIVKIGNQYWTTENLRATYYTNGTSIADQTKNLSSTSAGRYGTDKAITYNKGCILNGHMSPPGWRISTENDWNILSSYIKHHATVIKSTDQWPAINLVEKSSNLTGLNILPNGGFTANSNDKPTSAAPWGKGEAALFWSMGNIPNTLAAHGIMFRKTNNDFNPLSYKEHNYYAYSIRLVKE